MGCRTLAGVPALLGLALLLGTVSARGEGAADEQMVFIPAGEFLMGTGAEEADRLAQEYDVHPSLFATEVPQRKVYVKAFWIDRYPVTNAQYQKFVDETGHRPPPAWHGATCPEGLEDHPVVTVNWHDAAAYARWAGKRLPTEEEWEKAARGTDGRVYPWGNQWVEGACLPDDGSSPQLGLRTTPVGLFSAGASPYGVMDLVGNVAEWTSSYSQPPNAERGWAWYVVKGAANAHSLRCFFRCAARQFSAHSSRWHVWLGFRCARDAAPG
ncbi:MAG TPA: hypothetical protein EYH34_15160, partial [Planctomycetes bacterium]|nr:hypothetical protein [Planctomycetota bacterium]